MIRPSFQRAARRLAGLLLLSFAVAGGAFAQAPIDEGDKLYQRGYYEDAMAWWKEAAKKGSANAPYRLGVAHNDGVARDKQVIVARDFEAAAKWYTMAAELGDERAHFDLGSLYDNGMGVPKSPDLAAKWFLAGAERGQVACQYNIATMFETGTGVPMDLVAAYMWYYLAAQQDFVEFGGPALEGLAAKMQPDQVRSAIQMAKAFVIKPGAR